MKKKAFFYKSIEISKITHKTGQKNKQLIVMRTILITDNIKKWSLTDIYAFIYMLSILILSLHHYLEVSLCYVKCATLIRCFLMCVTQDNDDKSWKKWENFKEGSEFPLKWTKGYVSFEYNSHVNIKDAIIKREKVCHNCLKCFYIISISGVLTELRMWNDERRVIKSCWRHERMLKLLIISSLTAMI